MTTPYIAVKAANSLNYVVLVDVPGISGILEGIGVSGGEFQHFVRVTLDRVTIADNLVCRASGNYENTGLALHLPFGERLLIEIKDGQMATVVPRFWASYTISSSKLISEEPKLEEIKGVNYVYKVATFKSPEGKTYTVKSLEGNERVSKVYLDEDVYVRQRSDKIEGRVELKNWQGNPVRAEDVSLIVRPIGRTFKVDTYSIGIVDGQKEFEWREPRLPQGSFLVQTNLPGWANIPAELTVL